MLFAIYNAENYQNITKNNLIQTILILAILSSCQVSVDSQFLGPNRNGIYPEEGLLDKWPEEGPKLLWEFDSLGIGHSSPAITKNRIYITGLIDSMGYLFCLNHKGQLLWKESYGKDWNINYIGTRSTPTIAGNLLYLMTGHGKLLCYNIKKNKEIWSKTMKEDFGADSLKYGRSESILIAGDQLFCTPGGIDHNVVSLNRYSGELIWSSKGVGDPATHSSPIFINHNNLEILVVVTSNHILGLNPSNGSLLWSILFEPGAMEHSNSPFYNNGKLYMETESYLGKGGFIALELSENGKSVDVLWKHRNYRNLFSGIIVKDDCIFTCTYRGPDWLCLAAETGDTLYSWNGYPYGNLTYADGKFYVLSTEGEVLLCEGSKDEFSTLSSFQLDLEFLNPWAPLWAFPVIKDKRMYIRHKNRLFAFDIAQ